MRVSEELVESYLKWARNYGEIESYSRAADRGRKWLVKLPPGVTVTPSNMEPGFLEQRLVPDELMFTSREALAFGMGLAVAGARPETRTELANREWGW